MVTASPWQMNCVARVVIQEESPSFVADRPLISPTPAPVSIPITRHGTSPSPQYWHATPTMTPDRHPLIPTDRSISPAMQANAWPSAAAPIKMEPLRIDEKYFHVRKFLLMEAVMMQSTTIGIRMPTSGVNSARTTSSPGLREP